MAKEDSNDRIGLLSIENVDLEALEAQRLVLGQIDREKLPGWQGDALNGIQNMLDSWSDARIEHIHEQNGKKYKLVDCLVYGRCLGCAFSDSPKCLHAGGSEYRQCGEEFIYKEIK